MTPTIKDQIDQRLDQHADATEHILDRLDSIECRLRNVFRMIELDKRRLRDLESIVLPHKTPNR